MKKALPHSAIALLLFSTSILFSSEALSKNQLNYIEIAQNDVGMFVDSMGRKVYYDLTTDKILSIGKAPNLQKDLAPSPQTAARPALPIFKNLQDIPRLQVLLDRIGVSPGVIDGQTGSNVSKALMAAKEKTGRDYSELTADELNMELLINGGVAFVDYTITAKDVSEPFIPSIPVDYAEKALLPAMSYTSLAEKLAERFHMDQAYLRELNPHIDLAGVGSTIKVANPGSVVKEKVTRVEADKHLKQVRAYDAAGNLVVAYPATIGSVATPSPTGTVNIQRIAINPNYTYNPKINFTQGENKTVLTIPPGPNGPVGAVWMALSKPTYGIHGTPEPSRIGKTNSHGCIRLTNWDAKELAGMVSRGVTVEFLE